MNKAKLRELASITASQKEISRETADLILSKLTRAELKEYLFLLKKSMAERSVRIRTASPPDSEAEHDLRELFRERDVDIRFETSKSLGAGLQILYRDDVLELSARELVSRAIERIRENT